MSITLSQAQKAVGEGQDPNYHLEILKENSAVNLGDLPDATQRLLIEVRKHDCRQVDFKSRGGQWQPCPDPVLSVWANEKNFYRLSPSYTFSPDCPKTADCADCQHEFQPNGRTFTEAFLDDETVPYGAGFFIKGVRYAKILLTKRWAGLASLEAGGVSGKKYCFDEISLSTCSWASRRDLSIDPRDLMESDIEDITK